MRSLTFDNKLLMAPTNVYALSDTCSRWEEYLLALFKSTPKYLIVFLVMISPPTSIFKISGIRFPISMMKVRIVTPVRDHFNSFTDPVADVLRLTHNDHQCQIICKRNRI